MKKEAMIKPSSIIVIWCLCLLAGCAGGRGKITFDNLKYPASMSAFIYGDGNEMLSKGDLRVLDTFRYEKRFWGIFWSGIPLSSEKGIAEAINRKVEDAGGEGVINLAVTTSTCGINSLPLLSFLPVLPGCVNVKVEGEIVKTKTKGSSYIAPNHSEGLSYINIDEFVPKGKIGEAIAKNLHGEN